MDEADSNVRLAFSPSGEIVIRVDPYMTDWAEYSYQYRVLRFNPNLFLESQAYMQWVISHELGHTLGIGHANSGCSNSQSVMKELQPWDMTGTTTLYPGNCDDSYVSVYYEDPCYQNGCTSGYTRDTSLCSNPLGGVNDECGCCFNDTPLMVDLDGDGLRLSSAARGVPFDINGLGHVYQLGWPVSADDAWLGLDTNGNTIIDNGSELFGNTMRHPVTGELAADGFVALRWFDDNNDSVIDHRDPVYSRIRVWRDVRRDGLSEPSEVSALADVNIARIVLRVHESRRVDQWGNRFKYWATYYTAEGRPRKVIDVYPVGIPIEVPARACGPATVPFDRAFIRNRMAMSEAVGWPQLSSLNGRQRTAFTLSRMARLQ